MRRYTRSDTCNDELAQRFPIVRNLRDQSVLEIMPMVASDWPFYERFVASVLRVEPKAFDNARIVQNDQILYWCSRLNYERVLPIVGWQRGRIVTCGVLERDPDAWHKDSGRFFILVHPNYRHRGIGRLMVREFVALAPMWGLRELLTECPIHPQRTTSILTACGFMPVHRPSLDHDRSALGRRSFWMRHAVNVEAEDAIGCD